MAQRGVQVSDVPTSLLVTTPASSAAIVAIGAAPVHSLPGFSWIASGSGTSSWASVVNHPILCEIPSDFTTQLGLSSVFGPGAGFNGSYGLSEAYDCVFVENNAGPLICINVFDPQTMNTPVSQTNLPIVNSEIQISGEVILASLVVVGNTTHATYVQGVHYSYTYNDNSLQSGFITAFSAPMTTEASFNVNYSVPKLSLITTNTIIGGTDVNGNYLGQAVLEKVFTVTGVVPATVIAPGFMMQPTVTTAINAHVQSINNGRFRAIAICDVDTTACPQYTLINAWKNTNNIVSPFELLGWPHVALGSKHYHASTMLATMMQVTDAKYGNIPYVSPSNKSAPIDSTVIQATNTQITVDPAQADFLEKIGVFTFINYQGWKSLGDYTAAFGFDTDVKDFWINERRMFNWLGNTLSLTLAQFIDLPGNITSLTSINETIQAFLNTLVQAGAANTARVSFNPDENLVENILQGIYTFHILFSPPTPIRTLDLLLQFDVAGLTAFISSINLVSTP